MRRTFFALLLLAMSSNALAGFAEGKSALAQNDLPAAFQEFLAGANAGDARAQHAVALLYTRGMGTPRSDVDAAKWFQRSAELNNTHSQFNLGVMFHTGRGVPRSTRDAVLWYRKAAESGHVQAQNDLGLMLLTGDGAPHE